MNLATVVSWMLPFLDGASALALSQCSLSLRSKFGDLLPVKQLVRSLKNSAISTMRLANVTHFAGGVVTLDASGSTSRAGILRGGDAGLPRTRWRVAVGWEQGQDMSVHASASEMEAEAEAACMEELLASMSKLDVSNSEPMLSLTCSATSSKWTHAH